MPNTKERRNQKKKKERESFLWIYTNNLALIFFFFWLCLIFRCFLLLLLHACQVCKMVRTKRKGCKKKKINPTCNCSYNVCQCLYLHLSLGDPSTFWHVRNELRYLLCSFPSSCSGSSCHPVKMETKKFMSDYKRFEKEQQQQQKIIICYKLNRYINLENEYHSTSKATGYTHNSAMHTI